LPGTWPICKGFDIGAYGVSAKAVAEQIAKKTNAAIESSLFMGGLRGEPLDAR
jgi:hypothetical protein